jgi:hypothetical protein
MYIDEKNGNSISANFTEDTIANDWNMLVSDNSAVVFGLFVIAEETKYTHIA